LVARVRDLALGNVGEPSSLGTSLSMVAELLESRINTTAANGVHWGTRSVLVAILSHLSELKTKLELLGSGQNAYLIEDRVDPLWPLVSAASDSLASLIPSLVDRYHPDTAGE
jgi:hypothetical protein